MRLRTFAGLASSLAMRSPCAFAICVRLFTSLAVRSVTVSRSRMLVCTPARHSLASWFASPIAIAPPSFLAALPASFQLRHSRRHLDMRGEHRFQRRVGWGQDRPVAGIADAHEDALPVLPVKRDLDLAHNVS